MNYVETKIVAPAQGQLIIRDDELQGFGLRITPGSMSYICECRVAGKVRRVTIGKHGKPWTPETARKQALVILGGMAQGIDPARRKQEEKTLNLTLQQAFDEYMASKERRPLTQYNYPRLMRKKLGDWLNKPVTSITRDMVEERFRLLSSGSALGTSGKADANLTMTILRATLNFVQLKYEIDGTPLLVSNPVDRLTQLKIWHKLPPRQGVIPDRKLASWYKAVMEQGNPVCRDYYLVLLLTGMRRNEAPRLLWSDVDLEERSVHVRAEIAKNGQEYILPLSDFLFDLFSRRYAQRDDSPYVFPGYRRQGRYFGSESTLNKIRQSCGHHFLIHDLRRTYLTLAERLDLPHYVLKKLAGHSTHDDVTAAYLVINVERLRLPMQRITDRFLELMEVRIDQKSGSGEPLFAH
jgi:integrase